LPAVVHDHGQPSLHVMGDSRALDAVYAEAGKHHPVQVTVGKKEFLTIIKDVDTDPVKNRMRHLVFQAIKQDEKVETEVPVHLIGEIPAEKQGLMVIRQLDHVEIEALPKDLIDSLDVDASGLAEIGDHITVADIVVPANVTILTEINHPIATVEETKAQESEEAVSEEDEAAAVAAATGQDEEGADAPAEPKE
ncbi:MAG: 50S ribosomal protein L25, partial [Patescibacteria group bacterium]